MSCGNTDWYYYRNTQYKTGAFIAAKYFGNVLYSNVPLNLSISVPALIAAAMISLVTILISAYIPARKAAGIPVMECIRQTNDVKVEPKAVKTSKNLRAFIRFGRHFGIKEF